MKTIGTAARVAAKRPFRVSIEGNIGSGKSTCIKFFDKFQNVEKHPVRLPIIYLLNTLIEFLSELIFG